LRFGVGLRGLAAAAALIAPLHPCPSEADQAAISRGAYLAAAAGCGGCHTDSEHHGQAYAGGLPLATEFGIIPTPNITPDPATGIGRWSMPDFARAMRWGIAPDDSHYVPTFPHLFYNRLTDRDLADLKAFLDSLPAVSRPDLKGAGSTALLARTQAALAVSATPAPGPWQPDPQKDAVWNRGAYLVASIGRCGECHTPRNLAFALNNRRKFGGAVTAGWRAFNISSDKATGVGGWRDDDLISYLSTGHAAGHGTASGPMGEAVDHSFSQFASEDIRAIVAYMRSVPAVASTDLPATLAPLAPASHREGGTIADARGKRMFEGACVGCHGWSGQSAVSHFATLTGAWAVNDPTATNVAQIVISGTRRHTPDGVLSMPAFGNAYSDDEIAAVTNYVTARFGSQGSKLTASDIAELRKQTAD